MKRSPSYAWLVTLLVLLGATRMSAATFEDESITVGLNTYPIDHQGPQVIDVDVVLHFARGIADPDYPEVTEIKGRLEKLLVGYPNETDWWEIFVKRVSASLLAAYPMVERVSFTVNLHPTRDITYRNRYHCVARR